MSLNCEKFRSELKCCPKRKNWVRNGGFFRKSDSQLIQRWRCLSCGKTISQATGSPCFGQNKRRVNEPVRKLLSKGMAQRDIARFLNINRKTVARKLLFLSAQAVQKNKELLSVFEGQKITQVQFDEMETFEHTKLKPLDIPLIVEPEHRVILGTMVSEMPAKGPLAKASREKYGKRKDDRKKGALELFKEVDPYIHPEAEFLSDKNPKYRGWLKSHRESWRHETVKGRRGCVVGQGELKKVGFDPLFSLNHTCAMLRAKMSRLMRRTWNTTKEMKFLKHHLNVYIYEHNRKILSSLQPLAG